MSPIVLETIPMKLRLVGRAMDAIRDLRSRSLGTP
jgi:hypothetical protein